MNKTVKKILMKMDQILDKPLSRLRENGRRNISQTSLTIVPTVGPKFVEVNCIYEQQFSSDLFQNWTKEELYTFVSNAQTATVTAARIYKSK